MVLSRSFQHRIALISAGLSGAVLLVFAVTCWLYVYRGNLNAVDRQLREFGHREMSRAHHDLHWAQVRGALEYSFAGNLDDAPDVGLLMFSIGDDASRELYRSPSWPDALDASVLPQAPAVAAPEAYAQRPPPPRRRQDEGRRPGPPPPELAPDGRRGPGPAGRPPPRPHEMGRGGFDGAPPVERGRPEGAPPSIAVDEVIATVRADGEAWRVIALSNGLQQGYLAVNLSAFTADMARLTRAFLVAGPLGLILIWLAGYVVSRRALVPVHALTATAAGISAQDLSRRIPQREAPEEFEKLVLVFNDMLNRLERGFEQATRFSADAAHELKTPLAILQGQLERGIQDAESGSSTQLLCADLLEEVQRLKTIVRKLLLLSLADAGRLTPQRESVDLSYLLASSIEDVDVLAPELAVQSDVEPGMRVSADRDLLRQVVQNLVQNAIKYSAEDAQPKLRVLLQRDGDDVCLRIANTGAAIPASDRDRIFERFYRVDKARTRAVEGVGLGLSLSREIARVHRGELSLDPHGESGWTSFLLRLPLE